VSLVLFFSLMPSPTYLRVLPAHAGIQ